MLLLPAVMGLEFDPLCLIIIGAFAAVFVLIALLMLLLGAVHKSREKRSFEAMSEHVECAVEELNPDQTALEEEPTEVAMVVAPHAPEKKEKVSLFLSRPQIPVPQKSPKQPILAEKKSGIGWQAMCTRWV